MNTMAALILTLVIAGCGGEMPIPTGTGDTSTASDGVQVAIDGGASADTGISSACPSIAPLVYGITPCSTTTGVCRQQTQDGQYRGEVQPGCTVGGLLCVAACY